MRNTIWNLSFAILIVALSVFPIAVKADELPPAAIVYCGDGAVLGQNAQGKYEECDHGAQNGKDGICDANCQYVVGESTDPNCYQAKDDACQTQFGECLQGQGAACMQAFQDCLKEAVNGCDYPIKVVGAAVPGKDDPKNPDQPEQPQPQPQPDEPGVNIPPAQVAGPALELSGSKMGCSLETVSSGAGDLGAFLMLVALPLLRRKNSR